MAVWQPILNPSGLASGGAWTRLGTWRAEVFHAAEPPEDWAWEAVHDGDRRTITGWAGTREAAQAAERAILLQDQ
ncbi:hypothetical protein [Azospirillum rugosum]|uniref:Uncharacterized protein n=1 Tax=Azospirillum rugosum TaxID=416170 RepID=A0ABS4SP61_9PROT|nr:hypothetical protein [Azospirillum rugosum]MBP2294344.1 hypothetical protein [Azospirillum rugosum]MDQ0527679.1 hypothetical protein [Azospirillum rugosum]